MLDLKKYEKKASENPKFREKLLKNANQAIKEEFGDELPYKVKCKEKLIFEIEAAYEISDNNLSSIAGGSLPSGQIIIRDETESEPPFIIRDETESEPSSPIINPPDIQLIKGKTCLRRKGKKPRFAAASSQQQPLSNDQLSSIAGGSLPSGQIIIRDETESEPPFIIRDETESEPSSPIINPPDIQLIKGKTYLRRKGKKPRFAAASSQQQPLSNDQLSSIAGGGSNSNNENIPSPPYGVPSASPPHDPNALHRCWIPPNWADRLYRSDKDKKNN